MDDLCRPGKIVALVVRRNRTNYAVVNEKTPVAAVNGVYAAYAQDLGTARRLTGRDMDQKQ